MSETEILLGFRDVRIGDQSVRVRELPWPEALQFFERLADKALSLADPKGRIELLDPATLRQAVSHSAELIAWLLSHTADMPPERLKRLPPRSLMLLLDAALALNLSDEVISLGKRLAARLTQALGAQPPTGSASSPPSSSPG